MGRYERYEVFYKDVEYLFYKDEEYFKSLSELVHTEPENWHISQRISFGPVLFSGVETNVLHVKSLNTCMLFDIEQKAYLFS